MKRRVVRQGAATYTISLPARWIKEFGVKAGNELDVHERGKEIVISPEHVTTGRKTEIDVSGLEDALVRYYVITHYIQGDEEIIVDFADKKEAKIVLDLVNTLIGIAVVEQKKNALVIREISVPKSEEFDTFMRRLFFSIKQIGTESLENMIAKNWEGLAEMEELEKLEINKFSFLCMRILNKEGYKDFRKTSLIFDMIKVLENIGDEYWRICRDASETKTISLSEETKSIYKQINSLTDDIYSIFYKFDKEMLNQTYGTVKRLRKMKMEKLLEKKSKHETIVLLRLRKIAELMGYLLESIMVISL